MFIPLIAGLLAVWQKVKHGSADWYAIAGIFAFASLLVMLNFLKPKQPHSGGQTAHFNANGGDLNPEQGIATELKSLCDAFDLLREFRDYAINEPDYFFSMLSHAGDHINRQIRSYFSTEGL